MPLKPPKYTYFFTDLLTNQMLGYLPLQDVSAQCSLSSVGQFQASVNLASKKSRTQLPIDDIVIPQRSAYWVDRNGALVAGGIVWDDDYDSSEKVYKMVGATFDSYLDYQYIQSLLAYSDVDLDTIAIALWNDMQSKASSNIGVTVPLVGSILAGSTTTQAWDPSQQTTYGSAMQTISQLEPGFDYYVAVGYGPTGAPVKTLVLGDPYVGAAPSQTNLVFRRPGNVLEYTWPRYGSQSPNDMFGYGGGSGSSTLTSEYLNQARLNAGYPLVQGSVSYKNVYDQTVLDSLTAGWGAAVSNIVSAPTLVMAPNRTDTPIGSYNVGDPCRVVIEPDERFTNGLDTVMRIASINIIPSQRGQVERAEVTLALPPV